MDIVIPALAESVTEGDLGSWLKKDGDQVKKDDAILELETDKATVELAAETSGKLEILIQAGETVHVGDVVGRIVEDVAGAPPKEKKAEAPEPAAEPSQRKKPEPDRKKPEPEQSRRAKAELVEEGRPAARGKEARPEEAPGAVEEPEEEAREEAAAPREVAPAAGKEPRQPASAAEAEEPAQPEEARRDVGVGVEELTVVPGDLAEEPGERVEDEPGTRRERMSRLRLRIAERLVEAQRTAAILTTFNEVDMSGILALRQEHQEQFESQHGVRLGFMSLFARASVLALRDLPEINAFIDGNEIVYHDHVHLGIAVGTPRGLVVPVIRNADRISLAEIERRIKELATKARDGKIAIEDLQGGTFTISNGGIYGSLMSTPILNPPQSGILGMHKIEKRPVVLEDPEGGPDRIEARPMMYVALSYDHRLVDGEGAVTFLVKLKERLEEPTRLLLDG